MTLTEAQATARSYSCTIEPCEGGRFIVRRNAGDRGPFTADDLEAACGAARCLFKGVDPVTGKAPRFQCVRSARNAAFVWSRVVAIGTYGDFSEALRHARRQALASGEAVRIVLDGTKPRHGMPLTDCLAEVHQTGGFTVAPAYAEELLA